MDKLLLMKYEEMLTDGCINYPYEYFPYAEPVNQRLALDVIRYAVERILRWNPYELRDRLSWEILKKLKLDFFMKYLEFPVELDREKDLFYVAWLLYPKTIHLSASDLILNVYKAVINGSLTKFPKEFFSGTSGHARAIVCFRYALQNGRKFRSIQELYEFFAAPGIWNILGKHKLGTVCRDLFDSPVDMLHESLSSGQRDEFLYHYARFVYDRSVYQRNSFRLIADNPSGSNNDKYESSLSMMSVSGKA